MKYKTLTTNKFDVLKLQYRHLAESQITCSSDPPDAKKSPEREKATAVAGP